MIRLILIITVLVFMLYFVRKLINNNDKRDSSSKKMKYCPFCKSYVTEEQPCVNKEFDHSDLK